MTSRCRLSHVTLGTYVTLTLLLLPAPPGHGAEVSALGGCLQILPAEGRATGVCPLRHTEVVADIDGFLARVTVRQVFLNPTEQKIEAVYTFPLSRNAAVDDMVMIVGDRRIVGQVHEREEAREIYEQAVAAGHVASLLDQERPNIFTQSVANIEPGAEVSIEISYVETIAYEDGRFAWTFPMVVGPRYVPGGGSAPAPGTRGQDTPEVPDGSKITPPVTPPGTRAGHDISLTVNVRDGGLGLHDLASVLHEIVEDTSRPEVTRIELAQADTIPNRDFILRYRLGGEGIGDAFFVHEDERGRFFTLILQPPARIEPALIVPRELIFVLDTSGSMNGFPIEKAKETMQKLVGTMQPHDTFNIITFAGDTHILWETPQPATDANIAAAQAFLASRQGRGGTEMMKAINAALSPTAGVDTTESLRVVCFMTDGYVGNDMAIIDAVKQHAGTTRVFSFGIGNSVNRFLLDKMAAAGRGAVEYVSLAGDAGAAVTRFHDRVLAPVLTDIRVDWGTLPVSDVYPQMIPDLFSAKPIVMHGRLNGDQSGAIRLQGFTGAGPYNEEIQLRWPDTPPDGTALPSLWARAKVDCLMIQDYQAAQQGQFPDDLKQQVVELGLKYRLITQFTSFVAVEQMTVTTGGEPVRVDVPVELPAGLNYEGFFGQSAARGVPAHVGQNMMYCMKFMPAPSAAPTTPPPPSAGRRVQAAGVGGDGALLDGDGDEAAADEAATKVEPAQKLAEVLRDLAARVEAEGSGGNLTVGKLKVVDHRVDVMVFLADVSQKTRDALTELGFKQTAESKTTRLLIGSIDVRKLPALAALDVVVRVKPVVGS